MLLWVHVHHENRLHDKPYIKQQIFTNYVEINFYGNFLCAFNTCSICARTAEKDFSLITCSIRHASSVAVFSSTPNFISICDSIVCRVYIVWAMASPLSVRVIAPLSSTLTCPSLFKIDNALITLGLEKPNYSPTSIART